MSDDCYDDLFTTGFQFHTEYGEAPADTDGVVAGFHEYGEYGESRGVHWSAPQQDAAAPATDGSANATELNELATISDSSPSSPTSGNPDNRLRTVDDTKQDRAFALQPSLSVSNTLEDDDVETGQRVQDGSEAKPDQPSPHTLSAASTKARDTTTSEREKVEKRAATAAPAAAPAPAGAAGATEMSGQAKAGTSLPSSTASGIPDNMQRNVNDTKRGYPKHSPAVSATPEDGTSTDKLTHPGSASKPRLVPVPQQPAAPLHATRPRRPRRRMPAAATAAAAAAPTLASHTHAPAPKVRPTPEIRPRLAELVSCAPATVSTCLTAE